MSGLRPLESWIATSKAFNIITSTFCHPFQQQSPQHQLILYLPNLQVLRRSRLSCLYTWTPKYTSYLGPATVGLSSPISPGPSTGGQAEMVPDIATRTALRRDRLRTEDPRVPINLASGASTDFLKNNKLCISFNKGRCQNSGTHAVSYTHLTLPTKRIV